MKKVLILLSAALLFTACATNAPANSSATASAADATANAKQDLSYKMDSFQSDDPVHYSIEYPVFDDENLNKAIRQKVEDYKEEAKTTLNNALETIEDEEMFEALLFEVKTSVEQANTQDGVDLVFWLETNLGGPHPNREYAALMLDNKGNVIDPLSLFPSQEEGLKRLSEECRAQIRQNLGDTKDIDDMIVNGTEPVPSNFRNLYRKDGKIIVSFSPYEVAPYAAGPQECVISL